MSHTGHILPPALKWQQRTCSSSDQRSPRETQRPGLLSETGCMGTVARLSEDHVIMIHAPGKQTILITKRTSQNLSTQTPVKDQSSKD